MRKWVLIAALLVVFSIQAFAQKGSCLPLNGQRAYKDGERLELSLMFKWGAVNTEVAQAVVTLDSTRFKGESAYHTRLKVRSMPFFDIFFKMREDFQSWFRTRAMA